MKFYHFDNIFRTVPVPSGIGLCFFCLCLCASAAHAAARDAEPSDTLSYQLREVSVSAVAPSSVKMLEGGGVRLNPEALAFGARSLGETDIVYSLKRLSGVNTAGDYSAGLRIDGAESSQTIFRIDRVPVFFPYRFGGLFSTFNTHHFRSASFSRGIHDASSPSRLGARIDFDTPADVTRIGGTANVGLLSSSATLKVPAGKFSVIASARVSYVDQVYGALLRKLKTDLWYDFFDANLTANFNPDENNNISLNIFRSHDNLHYDDTNYSLGTRFRWNNTVASLRWRHIGRVVMNHRIYRSAFSNDMRLALPQMEMNVPSRISMYGIAGDMSFPSLKSEAVALTAGYEAQLYHNEPQKVYSYGINAVSSAAGAVDYRPVELRAYVSADWAMAPRLNLKAGISLSYFHNSDGYNTFSADPRVTLTWKPEFGALSLHLGRYSQFLHQVGFSETGMSGDFWLTATRKAPAQTAYAVVADYFRAFPYPGVSVSVQAYWRRVCGQQEYVGQMLDLLLPDYDASNYLMDGNGHNIGINVSVRKDSGPVTAALSAGYGLAIRRFRGFNEWMRGRTDPGFSVNAEAEWHIDSHWDVGAMFRLASGRPYTPAKSMYIIAGNLITEYGKPNSARFPTAHSLDLSVTWHTDTPLRNGRKLSHLLNFSLINAYGHRNIELRKHVINIKEGTFGIKEVSSLYRFLPSLGYTIIF